MTGGAALVAEAVDGEAVTELVREATRIPSVTPNEEAFAHWAWRQMAESDAFDSAELFECEPDRPNVCATAGDGSGRSLLLAGHLDTVAIDDWRQHWRGTDRQDPFGAHVIDGEIWGRGVADQKAGICATIEAVRAFSRAGLRPAGRVSMLFVCDEESGQPGSGVSAGMRAAVEGRAGPRPDADFAIYTEPTTSAIYTAQMGFPHRRHRLYGRLRLLRPSRARHRRAAGRAPPACPPVGALRPPAGVSARP